MYTSRFAVQSYFMYKLYTKKLPAQLTCIRSSQSCCSAYALCTNGLVFGRDMRDEQRARGGMCAMLCVVTLHIYGLSGVKLILIAGIFICRAIYIRKGTIIIEKRKSGFLIFTLTHPSYKIRKIELCDLRDNKIKMCDRLQKSGSINF